LCGSASHQVAQPSIPESAVAVILMAMESLSAAQESTVAMGKLTNKEEEEEVTSTTEETTSTAEVDTTTSESDGERTPVTEEMIQIEVIPATEEQKQEALRQYGDRFGRDFSKKSTLGGNRKYFPLDSNSEMQADDSRPAAEVLAELDRDLGEVAQAPAAAPSPVPAPEAKNENQLQATFGYAGGLDENPPFAKFDVRDHMCLKVGGHKHGETVRDRTGRELVVVGVKPVDGTDRLWFHPKDLGRPGAGAFRGVSRASLNMRVWPVPESEVQEEAPHFREMAPEDFLGAEDSDGEEMHLCRHCRLPVGERAFHYGKNKTPVHTECLEDILRADIKEQEEAYKKKDDEQKEMDRKHYEIGWHAEEIPNNMIPAVQLGCPEVPQGSCCLVFNREAHTVTVAPTLEPSESMNLEYLSLALQVRLTEGREPLFSLDPVDPSDDWKKDSMQFKRFEPEWLAGTSVGEVMFQADYHLKELSMGSYAQPVVGMKSCFDFASVEGLDKEWSAREWFIVRKAQVGVTEDNVLVPRVKMGIEARELLVDNDNNELVDMKTTRPNHPMVRYAEAFTKNFDLIAERKSVIFHLRELAKASVVAKMLMEAEVNLPETWLEIARESREFCPLEVPQLWNEREYSKLRVHDGGIEDESKDKNRHGRHGIYGGVNFGLDKAGVAVSPIVRGPAAGLSSIATGGIRVAPAAARLVTSGLVPLASAPSTAATAPGLLASRPAVGLAAMAMPPSGIPAAALQFTMAAMPPAAALFLGRPSLPLSAVAGPPNVITAKRPALALTASTVPVGLTKPRITVVQPRTLSLDTASKVLMPPMPRPTAGPLPQLTAPIKTGDPRGVDLNLDQFNLSEPVPVQGGGWAVAPDLKCAAIGSTFFASIDGPGSEFNEEDKNLLKAIYDPSLCDRRMEGEQFVPPDTSFDYVQKLRGLVDEEKLCRQQRQAHFFSSKYSVANPGELFPTDFLPTVEITKDSHSDKLHPRPDYKDQAQRFDRVLKSTTPTFDKCTEDDIRFRVYHIGSLEVRTIKEPMGEEVVGAVFSRGEAVECTRCEPNSPLEETEKIIKATEYIEKTHDCRNSYIVLETECHNMIVTEKLLDGTVTWVENPAELEDRNAFAKIVRTQDCKGHGVNVRFMKTYQRRESEPTTSHSKCKNYAQGAYARAVGIKSKQCSGFYKGAGSGKWQLSEQKYGLYASKNASVTCEEAGPTSTAEETRLSVGDKVEVKASGRVGQIAVDELGALPYKVVFEDGKLPNSRWCKESDVRLAEA